MPLWRRPGRRSVRAPLTVEHILASCALPLFFPTIRLGDAWHGDGGIQLTAPLSPALRPALRYVARTSRRLGRALFHAMVRHGPALEKRQLLLRRLVDIGTELFALSASALRADALLKSPASTATPASADATESPPRDELLALVNVIHAEARERIDAAFATLARNSDSAHYALAQELLADRHRHLRDGIV